jgi:hypothetical protein
VTKEVQDPSEERLRDLARKLGAAKKEIMAMNRCLMVGQSATLATEAHELASEAGEAIKASRETIKAALRGMGSGLRHIRGQRPHQGFAPAPSKARIGEPGHWMGTRRSAGSVGMAPAEHAGHDHLAPPGARAEAKNGRGGQRADSPHARADGCPSE